MKQKLDKSPVQMLFVISTGVLLSLFFFKLAIPTILNLPGTKFRISSNSLLTDNAISSQPQVTREAALSPGESIRITPASGAYLKNCTYIDNYWQGHPEAWMTENILVGKYTFSKEEILAILISPSQDHRMLLQKQFLTAILNISNGSDPSAIELVLADAADWMNVHPPRILLSSADYQREVNLTLQLSDYNNGLSGPGLCPGNPYTPTPLATLTPTSTATHKIAIQTMSIPTGALPEHRSLLSSPLAPSTPTQVLPAPPVPTQVEQPIPPTPVVVQPTAPPTPIIVEPIVTPAPPTSAITEPVITQSPTEQVNPTEPPPTENPQPTDPAKTPPGQEPKPTKESKPTKEPKPTETAQPTAPTFNLQPTNPIETPPDPGPKPTKEPKP